MPRCSRIHGSKIPWTKPSSSRLSTICWVPLAKVRCEPSCKSYVECAQCFTFAVPNLTLITPDNTTTITDYVNNYSTGAIGSNHWTGSTRIGTSSAGSVVDANTKVWNTNNLFIVDAGIVPGQPMGNPHAMLMVVGEIAVPKILALAGGA